MGRGRAGDEGRPVEPGSARASGGDDPDAVEVHRAAADHDDERPRVRGLGPTFPPPVPASPKATPQARPGRASLGTTCAAPRETGW